MPKTQHTKDFFKHVQNSLNGILGRLDKLIGIADRPGKNDQRSVSPQKAPTEEEYAAIGKMLFALHIVPSPIQKEQPKKRWYQTSDGRKDGLEKLGILFAIGYAIVTYCQWRDLKHNFEADQRAWINIAYEFLEPLEPDKFVVKLRLQNVGKSVALEESTRYKIEVLPADQPPSFVLSKNPPGEESDLFFPIGIGGQEITPVEIPGYLPEGREHLTAAEIEQLNDGKSYLAIFGLSTYRDQFGMHWTRFCNWHPYTTGPTVNTPAAESCIHWNAVGDGAPPKIRQEK